MASPSPNYAQMFKQMSSDRLSKSVKELSGPSNQYMNTWGEVDPSMQKEVEDEARRGHPAQRKANWGDTRWCILAAGHEGLSGEDCMDPRPYNNC